MSPLELLSAAFLLAGAAFCLAGTVGVLRFPDVYCRLHALTKVDNLGLGLVVAGLALQSASWATALKLFLVWLFVLISSAFTCQLIARAALRRGAVPSGGRREP
ncbi:monovalent cation/H(+) antiporter subunit G [Myxococcus qinghaiensis]|uniref:monovalent cation/H(+) antiporter subunit G n=1 Tax=Myxococcus qinghaiensis TaxID=2906758 RepID=UPI0020A7E6A0|nr:monovalent cation/H(+) antiporter subunit G [Myxococcus qinghaiensis]MCP3166739.1 monovalent cation/H(+) antiporter subunit G [Myxococcus qinghaiensis]